MDALQALLSRRSIPVPYLSSPGPAQAQIQAAIDAAARAPDHGQLHPLRLVLIQGAAREQLAQLFVDCMRARQPPPPESKIDKARRWPLTAPLIIAAGAHLQLQHPKVPELEQLLSAGAGVMNLLQAFHAQGFGALWLTGANAYDPRVGARLGFAANERCLGFVYVGSIVADVPVQPAPTAAARAAREQMVRDWRG